MTTVLILSRNVEMSVTSSIMIALKAVLKSSTAAAWRIAHVLMTHRFNVKPTKFILMFLRRGQLWPVLKSISKNRRTKFLTIRLFCLQDWVTKRLSKNRLENSIHIYILKHKKVLKIDHYYTTKIFLTLVYHQKSRFASKWIQLAAFMIIINDNIQ